MGVKNRFTAVQPWLSLLVRLGMAGILIAAAIPKAVDIPQSVRAVRAYQLLPEALVPFVGTMLPFLELVLALVFIIGIFTRSASVVWLLMMAGFLVGVIWAWSQGLSIDCGCFGGGGEVDASETQYPMHVLERIGFIALGTYLVIWPRSKFSVDNWLAPKPLASEVESTTPETRK